MTPPPAFMSSTQISNLPCRSRFVQVVQIPPATVRRMRADRIARVRCERQAEIVAVKYALTTLAALSFGSLSFRVSHMLGWNQFGERLFVFTGGLIAAAFICAPLWA